MTTTGQLGQTPVELTSPQDDDLRLWSVTTIIDVLDKQGLMWWAAGRTADDAIDSEATWKAMLSDRGRLEAWKWLRMAHKRSPLNLLSATDLGGVAHSVCEQYALSGEKPDAAFISDLIYRKGGEFIDLDHETDTITQMLDQFDRWLQQFQPSYQATEVCVYSPTYGYAGQCDAFLTIDGTRFIADYKSSREPFDGQGRPKTPYPESVGLQLAAYRGAEMAAVWRPRRFEQFRRRYYALSPQEQELAVPVPEVDTGLVIMLTTQACDAYPIKCDDEVHTAFLYCLEMARWVNETSKTVMGEPLTPETRPDA
jgi:hypothetical protein